MSEQEVIHDISVTTDSTGSTGAVVLWTLRGETSLDELTAVWVEKGLDPKLLPSPPSPAAALQRAIAELKGASRIVRPTKVGWAVFDEASTGEDELSFSTALKARVDKIGRLQVQGGTDVDRLKLEGAFRGYCDNLSTQDVTAWLVRMVTRASAVAIRPSGGVYFVPAFAMPGWEAVVAAVKLSSAHNVYAIPAVRNADIIAAVTEALEKEAVEAVESLEAELAEKGADMKRAPLERRIKTTNELEAKLSGYEHLMGTNLAALRKKIEAVRAEITKAIILTETPS